MRGKETGWAEAASAKAVPIGAMWGPGTLRPKDGGVRPAPRTNLANDLVYVRLGDLKPAGDDVKRDGTAPHGVNVPQGLVLAGSCRDERHPSAGVRRPLHERRQGHAVRRKREEKVRKEEGGA